MYQQSCLLHFLKGKYVHFAVEHKQGGFFQLDLGKIYIFFKTDIFKIIFAIIRKSFYSYSDLTHTPVLSSPHCFGLADIMRDGGYSRRRLDSHRYIRYY